MKTQYLKIDEDGTKSYFSNKKMTRYHREDGPAIEAQDGYKAWFLNGVRHREDGPAIEWSATSDSWWREKCPDSWWIHGKNVSEENHPYYLNSKKAKTVNINGKDFTLEELNSLIESAKGN